MLSGAFHEQHGLGITGREANDHGYIIGGYYSSSPLPGGFDMQVAKTDDQGVPQWKHGYAVFTPPGPLSWSDEYIWSVDVLPASSGYMVAADTRYINSNNVPDSNV